MKLYDLGHVDWLDSQLLYHALPRVGEEGILILAPSTPYVCIGWHQDVEADVDLDYCRDHAIPVFRREVGGGAVFLDGKQIFFQIVLNRDNPLAGGDKASLYRRMLSPVVRAYADLGVATVYRPVNDIVTTAGRKISGTGAAEIADSIVVVGNLIEDFDYQTMTRVLRVPDEKFRDKIFRSMQENLTTLRRETGRGFSWEEMASAMVRRFEEVLGKLTRGSVSQAVRDKAREIAPLLTGEEWLAGRRRKGSRTEARDVKIATGVSVVQRIHKAPGGLLRAVMELRDGRFESVSLSGDFFCYPRDGVETLAESLRGMMPSEALERIQAMYEERVLDTPGVTPADWGALLAPGPISPSPSPPPRRAPS